MNKVYPQKFIGQGGLRKYFFPTPAKGGAKGAFSAKKLPAFWREAFLKNLFFLKLCADCGKGLAAYVMLDFAGVRLGGFAVDAKAFKKLGEHVVAVKCA